MSFPIGLLKQTATPAYFYDTQLLARTIDEAVSAAGRSDYHIHYAVKANANPKILRLIANAGLGADCVSGGEITRALECGFNASSIVFAGVGKSDAEIELALSACIGCFNVESLAELSVIAEIAGKLGKTARVAFRINPDVDPHTHSYISTGLKENKFGISPELLPPLMDLACNNPHLEPVGLHFHIGSQLTDMGPYRLLCDRINEIQDIWGAKGITFDSINVGGGLGINYEDPDKHPVPDFKAYFEIFKQNLRLREGQQLHFELGRSIVGQCGSLITRVLYVKEGLTRKFAIVDAGMTDLIRPALYQAYHRIDNLTNPEGSPELYDVVGPICESSDRFAEQRSLPEVKRGDLLAIRSAGAYGEVMTMNYNCRPAPASVML